MKLNAFQKEHGNESYKLLKKYFPEVVEEIKGITETLNFDHETFASWMMCMGCCLIIRENHNIKTRVGTVFSFVKNNKSYYGRNNDLPPYLKDVSKSIYYDPVKGYKFILNTSSFVNGEEGINEKGLVATMTFVKPKPEEIMPGFNSLFIVRYLLEKCMTVRDSLKTIKKLPIASSCNILLADKNNEMVVVECTPLELNVRIPKNNKRGENFIVAVNHFTSEKMSKHDASNKNVYSSKIRYETAYNALEKGDYEDPITFSRDLLSGKHGFICQYKNIKFETIWSTIIDVFNKKVYMADGNPQKTKFSENKWCDFL
ncbi:MAG: C45 family autoproteolytic acyltransferase/hydrolase [Promethearchaeota archaeon]